MSEIHDNSDDIITSCIPLVQEAVKDQDAIHGWNHIIEVMDIAQQLLFSHPKADIEIVTLAVLFHDSVYHSYDTHVKDSIEFAQKTLAALGYPKERIGFVLRTMRAHSGPHRREDGDADFIEGMILYDADKFRMLKSKERKEKYYPQLYLDETRRLFDSLQIQEE